MSPSLSVILPVTNAESILASKLIELLEIVSELTDAIDVLIVDDGSTDNTEEVAAELCRQFPQVALLRQSILDGQIDAAQLGIANTTGDIVLVHDITTSLSTHAIRQFWSRRNDLEVLSAGSELARDRASYLNAQPLGTWMLRREAVEQLPSPPSTAGMERVTRTDLGRQKHSDPLLRRLADKQTSE